MPERRIGPVPQEKWQKKAIPKKRCNSREHTPGRNKHRAPGIYEHTCPECGETTRFIVQETFWVRGE